jgi:hypothetical protein
LGIIDQVANPELIKELESTPCDNFIRRLETREMLVNVRSMRPYRKARRAFAYAACSGGGSDNSGNSIAKQVPKRVRSFFFSNDSHRSELVFFWSSLKRRGSASLLVSGCDTNNPGHPRQNSPTATVAAASALKALAMEAVAMKVAVARAATQKRSR